jgi:hypothetical protein
VQQDWQRLASVLLEALGDHVARQRRPTWVFVAPADGAEGEDAFALGLSDEPDALDGIAPPEWQAVGVVGTGRAFRLDGGRGGRGCSGIRINGVEEPFRMACLLTREGRAYCKAVLASGQIIEDPPEAGLLINELRSCFDLPPLPPPVVPTNVQLPR